MASGRGAAALGDGEALAQGKADVRVGVEPGQPLEQAVELEEAFGHREVLVEDRDG